MTTLLQQIFPKLDMCPFNPCIDDHVKYNRIVNVLFFFFLFRRILQVCSIKAVPSATPHTETSSRSGPSAASHDFIPPVGWLGRSSSEQTACQKHQCLQQKIEKQHLLEHIISVFKSHLKWLNEHAPLMCFSCEHVSFFELLPVHTARAPP